MNANNTEEHSKRAHAVNIDLIEKAKATSSRDKKHLASLRAPSDMQAAGAESISTG